MNEWVVEVWIHFAFFCIQLALSEALNARKEGRK